jgi:hypothetical protein
MSARFQKILVIALGLMVASFSGCGGGGTSSDSGSGTPLPSRVLSWEAPTSYVDTTAMNPVTDLDRFEIHVNETGAFTDADAPMAEVTAVDPATHTLSTSFNLAKIGPPLKAGPQYYVSLRAVAITGLKSDYSPPVSFSF